MKVIMVCSGGMSSAIVVKAIKAEAAKQDFDLDMIAVGSGAVEDELKDSDYKLLLVAPQVKHQFATFEKYANENGVPIGKVEPMGYTPIGAPKTLELIKKYR